MSRHAAVALVLSVLVLDFHTRAAQGPVTTAAPAGPPAQHAREVRRLLIRGAMVIPGTGVPAYGPVDLLIEGGTIARIGNAAAEQWAPADAVIDAAGKYVMPGIVNTHMHWHEERVGPIPIQYERDLYLAAGVTTARSVGGDFEKIKLWRSQSAAHNIVASRILLYPMLADLLAPGESAPVTPQDFRALVRRAKDRSADGIKLIGPYDKDQALAALDEAKKLGLPTTV